MTVGPRYASEGLPATEVNERLAAGLVNSNTTTTSRSFVDIIRGNLVNLFNGIVGACFVLVLIVGDWEDSLFGWALVFNLLIGVIQEFTAKRTLDRLAILNQPLARVRRDGVVSEIRREFVVMDDLLIVRAGDQILADGIVLESLGLDVDESMLTGESEPVAKTEDTSVMSGCGVVAGSGTVRVNAVGADTYSSRITAEARRFSLVNSDLRNSLARVIRWVSWALIPLILIAVNGQVNALGGWGELAGDEWRTVVVRSVSSIVAMVPQGLVLITSIAFALAAVKLARRRVLVQELYAVEGLARVDVLCCDKTGTLTGGEIRFDALREMSPSPVGTQSATVVLGLFAHDDNANATASALRRPFPLIPVPVDSRVPFSSERKWSSVSIAGPKTQTWVLGAPEIVLNSSQEHARARSEAIALAESGLRTLVLAVSKSEGAAEGELPGGLNPVAVVTFAEKVREDAQETLEYFREQGVDVYVISGDNPSTVASIARTAGIDVAEPYDARKLPESFDELAPILRDYRVFGRVTPDQKRHIMAALQSQGRVVAMIGDGVNDALALKHADLGIAMGSGASATKAVANVILLDGQFAALPGIVDEGRKVIANIERLSRLFLTKTVWAMILAVVFGLTLAAYPFEPRQLSAVDFFTIGIPAFLLALLPNAKRYLPGFLERSLWFVAPTGMVTAAAVLTLDSIIRLNGSWSETESHTGISLLLGITGLWVLALLALPLDRNRIAIVAGMVAAAIGVFLIPPIASFFGFTLLSAPQFGMVVAIGGVAVAFISLITWLIDHRHPAGSNG
jgi:cation-transporting P-type ATPase E